MSRIFFFLLDGEGLDEDLGLVTLLGVEGDVVGVSVLWLETKRLLSENIPQSEQSATLHCRTFLIGVKTSRGLLLAAAGESSFAP